MIPLYIQDVTLSHDHQGFIKTNTFRKETASTSYLHASSAHPRHVIDAVPTGQYLHIRRICSSQEDFEKQAKLMQKRFKECRYSHRCLKRAYKRAKDTPRQNLLYDKRKKTHDDSTRFITDYNCQWMKMKECIEKHLTILRTDPILRKIYGISLSRIPMKFAHMILNTPEASIQTGVHNYNHVLIFIMCIII